MRGKNATTFKPSRPNHTVKSKWKTYRGTWYQCVTQHYSNLASRFLLSLKSPYGDQTVADTACLHLPKPDPISFHQGKSTKTTILLGEGKHVKTTKITFFEQLWYYISQLVEAKLFLWSFTVTSNLDVANNFCNYYSSVHYILVYPRALLKQISDLRENSVNTTGRPGHVYHFIHALNNLIVCRVVSIQIYRVNGVFVVFMSESLSWRTFYSIITGTIVIDLINIILQQKI